jgi:hypothetical protein
MVNGILTGRIKKAADRFLMAKLRYVDEAPETRKR